MRLKSSALWVSGLGVMILAVAIYFLGPRAPRLTAASGAEPLHLVGIVPIPASASIDRLWDYATHSTGLYFLVHEETGVVELVHTDFRGALLHRFSFPPSTHRRGKLAVSQAGALAVMRIATKRSSEVWLYRTIGTTPDQLLPGQNVSEIAFNGEDLVGASEDHILRMTTNGNVGAPSATTSFAPILESPFALLPLSPGRLGVVEYPSGQFRFASVTTPASIMSSPFLMGGAEVQEIPEDAAKNGAGKMYSATSDEEGRIYLGLPNFQPHRDLVLELDQNGTVIRDLHFTTMPPLPTRTADGHLHAMKLRVTNNKLFVSYTAYQDRIAYYEFN